MALESKADIRRSLLATLSSKAEGWAGAKFGDPKRTKRLIRWLAKETQVGIRVKGTPADEKELPLGASKVGPSIDIPAVGGEKYVRDELADFPNEVYPPTLIAQINCADLAPHDLEDLLPHVGLLYFYGGDPTVDEPTGTVFYEPNPVGLVRRELKNWAANVSTTSYRLDFSPYLAGFGDGWDAGLRKAARARRLDAEDFMLETNQGFFPGHLLGAMHGVQFFPVASDEVPLAYFSDEMGAEEFAASYPSAAFVIKKSDLLARNFARCRFAAQAD